MTPPIIDLANAIVTDWMTDPTPEHLEMLTGPHTDRHGAAAVWRAVALVMSEELVEAAIERATAQGSTNQAEWRNA